jgi:hypothetical protein
MQAADAHSRSTMPVELEAFLAAYKPKFICLGCLSRVTEREAEHVKIAVDALLITRRAECQVAECLNCNAVSFVVRRR